MVCDDKMYLRLKNDRFGAKKGFYKPADMSKGDAPDEVRLRSQEKFPKKVSMGIAISQKGILEIFFLSSGQAVKIIFYRKKCIQEHLVLFLDQYHAGGLYNFFPDLAISLYAKAPLELLEDGNIADVPKAKNPPKCPQLEPIETFFSHFIYRVYKGGWKTSIFSAPKRLVRAKLKEFDLQYCQNLFCHDKSNLQKAVDHGVLSVNNR